MQVLIEAGLELPKTALRSKSKERFAVILAGALMMVLLLVWGLNCPGGLERINNVVIDLQTRLLKRTEPSNIPVIVEVDEKSLEEFGQWPWPRYRVARLLEGLQKAGVSAVGVDAIFVESDRTSPVEIKRTVGQDLNQALDLGSIEESLRDFDKILGKTLLQGPFVLSYFFTFDEQSRKTCSLNSSTGAALSLGGEISQRRLPTATGVLCNISVLQESAKQSGFINSAPDRDGLYRKTPLVIQYENRLYPSLALQTYLTAKKLDSFVLTSGDTGLTLKMGQTAVPLDKAGNLLIKFPEPQPSFRRISAADVLVGRFEAQELADKIVFIGFSAAGLHEFRPTPDAPQYLGVDFHAAIVDNLLKGEFLQRPSNSQTAELLFSAIVGLLLFWGLAGAGFYISVLVPLILISLLLASTQAILASTGLVISPALPVLTVLFVFLTLTVIKYAIEYRRAKQMAILVARTHEGIIGSFCSMSEYRDPETGAHIRRTQEYIKALAKHLQDHPRFKDELTNEYIELIFKAAPLHDIGKIGIRDYILLKNDRLDENEFMVMKTHPQIGADIIDSVANQTGWNPFMIIARQICLCHQEKWDGSGYPNNLAGDAIPLSARFMALADVYDALISKRCYKAAFSHQHAVALIKEGKGSHFDPELVEAFVQIQDQFKEIALNFLDNEEQRNTLLAIK